MVQTQKIILFQFSSVLSLSFVRLFATPLPVACQASLSITNSQNLLKGLISIWIVQFSSVQFSRSVVSDSLRPHGLQQSGLPVITNSQSLLKLLAIELVMLPNHLILCRPHLLPPSIFLSIRVFSNESVLHLRWSKGWSFSFSISPSNEYSGLISSRMDWLDLLAVQGTLKSLLQHPTDVQKHQFFGDQLPL